MPSDEVMARYQDLCHMWDEVWGGDAENFRGHPDEYEWLETNYGIDEAEDVVWQIIQEIFDTGLSFEEEAGFVEPLRPLLDDEEGLKLFMTVMSKKLSRDPSVEGLRVRHCSGCGKALALVDSDWYACEGEECGYGSHKGNQDGPYGICSICGMKHEGPFNFANICATCAKSHAHPLAKR